MKPTAEKICQAFLNVINTRTPLELDPMLCAQSWYDAKAKVAAYMDSGTPRHRFSHDFRDAADREKIATEVMTALGCRPRDIRATLQNTPGLSELYDVLKLAG